MRIPFLNFVLQAKHAVEVESIIVLVVGLLRYFHGEHGLKAVVHFLLGVDFILDVVQRRLDISSVSSATMEDQLTVRVPSILNPMVYLILQCHMLPENHPLLKLAWTVGPELGIDKVWLEVLVGSFQGEHHLSLLLPLGCQVFV